MRRIPLGALRERDFRLLFASTTVDAVEIVLVARQATQAATAALLLSGRASVVAVA